MGQVLCCVTPLLTSKLYYLRLIKVLKDGEHTSCLEAVQLIPKVIKSCKNERPETVVS